MSGVSQLAARPAPGVIPQSSSKYRSLGLAVAVLGMMGTVAAVIGNIVAADGINATTGYKETFAWTFGLSIFSFGVVKIAIAITLTGIIGRLWTRADAIKDALVVLQGHGDDPSIVRGTIKTQWGSTQVSDEAPKPLLIHRMALFMWRPMLAMGFMALTAGLVSSLVWADQAPGTESFRQAAAFTQGIEFLGETFLLSGIAFLLGSIMAGLRTAGGEVQSSLGLPVTTLKMPVTGKAFIGLMMMGMMTGVAQFVLYVLAIGNASDPASFSAWLNWLGPLRELALGLILAGIVLALVTIGNVLAFQFNRVNSIIRTGA